MTAVTKEGETEKDGARQGQDFLNLSVEELSPKNVKRFPVIAAGETKFMEVKVKVLKKGTELVVRVREDETVEGLKTEILGLTGFPINTQRLVIKGKAMVNPKRLGDYGVAGGTVVHLLEKSPETEDKEKEKEKEKVESTPQPVATTPSPVSSGVVVSNDGGLHPVGGETKGPEGWFSIPHFSKTFLSLFSFYLLPPPLTFPPPQIIEIEVKVKVLQKGTDVVIKVRPGETVERLKEIIARQVGIPVGAQRLILKGKVLNNPKTLSECGVTPGSVVHLQEKPAAPEVCNTISLYTSCHLLTVHLSLRKRIFSVP